MPHVARFRRTGGGDVHGRPLHFLVARFSIALHHGCEPEYESCMRSVWPATMASVCTPNGGGGCVAGLLWNLRAGLGRDQCGLGHPRLYAHTYVGTKALVETYVAQAANLLQVVQLPLPNQLGALRIVFARE